MLHETGEVEVFLPLSIALELFFEKQEEKEAISIDQIIMLVS